MRRALSQIPSVAKAFAGYGCNSSVDLVGRLPLTQSLEQISGVVSKPAAAYLSSRYLSTEAVDATDNQAKKNAEKPSDEHKESFSDQLETELPDVEEIPQEALDQLSGQYKSILDEKDDALKQLSVQIEEERKKLLQALADAENLRQRFARETAQTKKFAIQGFVQKLLGCLDNLDRAVDSVPEEIKAATEEQATEPAKLQNAMSGLLSGVRMTQAEFRNVLSSHGVERFDPIGEAFDPNSHMARFELDDPSKEPGTIGIVTLCGYKMHDRVIRPADVGVVRKPAEEKIPETEEKSEAS